MEETHSEINDKTNIKQQKNVEDLNRENEY